MEQKNNSGSLYKNRKEKPTQPDYNGTATIDGKLYRMSGWVNKSKAGTNYLRVLFTEQGNNELPPKHVFDKLQDLNATAGQATMPMQPQNSQQNIDSVILDDLPF